MEEKVHSVLVLFPLELGGGREGGSRKQADDKTGVIYSLDCSFIVICYSPSCDHVSKNSYLNDKTPLTSVEQRHWTLLSLIFYKHLFYVFIALRL